LVNKYPLLQYGFEVVLVGQIISWLNGDYVNYERCVNSIFESVEYGTEAWNAFYGNVPGDYGYVAFQAYMGLEVIWRYGLFSCAELLGLN
jgi:hypothetical protein